MLEFEQGASITWPGVLRSCSALCHIRSKTSLGRDGIFTSLNDSDKDTLSGMVDKLGSEMTTLVHSLFLREADETFERW